MAAIAAKSSESAVYSAQQLRSLAGQIEKCLHSIYQSSLRRLRHNFSDGCKLTFISDSRTNRIIEAVTIEDVAESASNLATELVAGAKKCSGEMRFQFDSGPVMFCFALRALENA